MSDPADPAMGLTLAVEPANQPVTQRDLLRDLRRLPLPMPTTTRELYELLALYEPSEGLDALVARLDMSGVTPQHIYRVLHRRPPESIEQALRSEGYDPREHFKAALLSGEFRENLLKSLVLAFPEKRRDVFVHIPKCAGTDLILNVAPNRLSIPKVLEDPRWVSDAVFLDAVRSIVRAIPYYDAFFIYGHMILGNYLDTVRASTGEKIFTVIRDPIDTMLSQVNYAVTRLRRDPTGSDPDSREILEALQIPRLPNPPTLREMRELALRALRIPKIARPNSTCLHLGSSGHATYEAALQNLVIYDVEVSTTRRYGDWLKQRWEIYSQTRHNLSDHWLSVDDIDDETAEIMLEQSAEDRKLFTLVSTLIDQAGSPSISGGEIARLMRSGGIDAPDADAAGKTVLANRNRQSKRRRGMLTAVGARAMEAFLRASGDAVPEFALQFGAGGDLNKYEHAGWAQPEPGFTWTSAKTAWVSVPKPRRRGDYRLRLAVAPFVVRDKLPEQRLTVIVNGIVVGETAIRENIVVEYELPSAVLGGDDLIAFTFDLPNAAQPRAITQAADDRLLGLAFTRIEVIHCDDLPETVPAPFGAAEAAGGAKPAAPRPTFVPKADAPPIDLNRLMMGFESLGENCEFGLVQRRCGAEPLGLFRFASAPLPKLMAGIEAGFADMADPHNLTVHLSDGGAEYMVQDRRFGFLYHAWVLAGEMRPEEIHAREVKRLPLLIRKLIEEFEQGEKIFVYHGMDPVQRDEARALLALLRRYGPGVLLWVELADAEHAPGTVEWAAPGLLKGYIDRLAPGEDAHDISLDCWIEICREATSMQHAATSAVGADMVEPMRAEPIGLKEDGPDPASRPRPAEPRSERQVQVVS